MTYNVFGGKLSLTQSINHWQLVVTLGFSPSRKLHIVHFLHSVLPIALIQTYFNVALIHSTSLQAVRHQAICTVTL